MKDLLNGYLLSTEGVQTRQGYDTGFDATTSEAFYKGMGLPPTRLAQFQEGRNKEYGDRRSRDAKRSGLKQQWIMAKETGDTDEADRIREKIEDYNEANPSNKLRPDELYGSFVNRIQTRNNPNFFMGSTRSQKDDNTAREVMDVYRHEED